MDQFSDRGKAEYYHRCYQAADGLWFVKTEEEFDFDTALDLDKKVWEVMPKIQARFFKKKLSVDKGLDALCKCFSKKLELDGFKFEVERSIPEDGMGGNIGFKISKCPWHDILVKSKRSHLSDKIGGIICGTEYNVWALEFGPDIKFSFKKNRICRKDSSCILSFRIYKD